MSTPSPGCACPPLAAAGSSLPLPVAGHDSRAATSPRIPTPQTLTWGLTRGVCRHLAEAGHAVLTEFRLPNRRRADVAALDAGGRLLLVEVKSALADFRADDKWPEYLPWCDAFAFAVADSFPRQVLPEACGLLIADPWGAEVIRLPALPPLAPARRRALTLRFARLAAERLTRLLDPAP